MEIVLIIGIAAIVITGLSIDGKLRKTTEQNQQIIELLKQSKENGRD